MNIGNGQSDGNDVTARVRISVIVVCVNV